MRSRRPFKAAGDAPPVALPLRPATCAAGNRWPVRPRIARNLRPLLALGLLVVFLLASFFGCAGRPSQLGWAPANRGLPGASPALAVATDPRRPAFLMASVAAPPHLYRSRDHGVTWEQVGHELRGRLVYALLFVPNAPDVVLAGTSDGLWRSTDAGRTWQPVGPDLPQPVSLPAGLARHGRSVYSLQAGPDGAIYLAGEGARLWRSRNAGASWEPLSPLPGATAILAIAISLDGRRLLAGTDGAGLFRSDDAGLSWQAAADIPVTFVAGLWFDPALDGLVYARTRAGLYRSDDAGRSWQPMAAEVEARIDAVLPGPAAGHALALTNSGPVYRTRDGGRRWEPHGDLGRDGAIYAVLRWPDPGGERLLAAAHAGLLFSDDAGRAWQLWEAAPGFAAANDLAQAPDGTLYLASSDGVYRSTDAGATWTPAGQGLPPAAVLSVAAAPSRPEVLYAGTDGRGLYRSDDAGRTWARTGLDVPTVPGILIHPADPDRLWIRAAFQRVYESRDGGRTWFTPWNGLDLSTELMFLGYRPADPPILYAAGTQALFRSLDEAASWQPIGPQLAGQTVFHLLADPDDPGRLYAAATKGVYTSADDGATWEPWGRGLEEITASALLFHPGRRAVAFAGTKYRGIYRTTDAGRTWHPVGLDGMSVRRLVITADGRWLLAATDQGVWRAALGGGR